MNIVIAYIVVIVYLLSRFLFSFTKKSLLDCLPFEKEFRFQRLAKMQSTKVYDVCIVEDEYPARMLMMDFVMRCPELKLSGIAENGEKALQLLKERSFAIVFLDIQLPGKTGIEVLQNQETSKTKFIFTTAYSEFAVSAFELEAVDYLLKPFSFERFRKAVDKALLSLKDRDLKIPSQRTPLESTEVFKFTYESAMYLMPVKDIIYISASNKTSVLHTKEKDYEVNKLIKDLEAQLPASQFIRIHKGYMVNLAFVGNVRYDKGGSYLLQLKNEDETSLPVGRAFADRFKEELGI